MTLYVWCAAGELNGSSIADEDKSAIDRALQRTREMLDRKKNSQTSGAEKVVEMVSAGVHVKKEPLFSSG